MKGFTPRFAAPLDAPRPRGARLLEAFSPKLCRRIRLFDHPCFEQWIRLEADPFGYDLPAAGVLLEGIG